jgi:ubiquinol-cytochrome c reductase cytochrome c1 subunit
MRSRLLKIVMAGAASALLAGAVVSAEAAGGATAAAWQDWKAGNDVTDVASLQRGATNFVNYCLGCHSVKYMRYSRMAEDLGISDAQLRANLIPTAAKPTDYMLSSFPAADAEAWFGLAPPDLSLTARAKGPDYIYRFLKGFYVDTTKPTGTNNLALDGTAMPAVLSDLEGVKAAVFSENASGVRHVEHFDEVAPGRLSAAEFDGFVRDTVNFLDYVGEPAQVQRRGVGIWVVMFLLAFTVLAWLLKAEYWRDVD